MPLISSLGVMNAINFGFQGKIVNVILPTIAVSSQSSPFITAYPWSSTSGYGTKYANPSSLPTGLSRTVSFSPSKQSLIVGSDITPFVCGYPFINGTGFGTKYADISAGPNGGVRSSSFNTTGSSISLGGPGITKYNFSDATGFGSSIWGGLFTETIYALRNVPSGSLANYLLLGSATANYIRVVNTANSTTSKSSTGAPVGRVTGIDVDVINNRVIVANNGATGLGAYSWSGSASSLTRLANPSIMPNGTLGYACTFSPNYDYAAFLHNNSTMSEISVYAWNGNFGTKVSDPSTPLSPIVASDIKYSSDGLSVHLTRFNSPNVVAYRWSSGFGTRYTDITTTGGTAYGLSFNNL